METTHHAYEHFKFGREEGRLTGLRQAAEMVLAWQERGRAHPAVYAEIVGLIAELERGE